MGEFTGFFYLFFSIFIALFLSGIHKVPEGHVAVYFDRGRLLEGLGEPGFGVIFPFWQKFELVQVTTQTDEVRNIPCGTKGGVMIDFAKIEVVNKLNKPFVIDTIRNYTSNYDHIWIYDKIHHEINQFCSHHTLREVTIELFESLDESLMAALQEDCEIWAPGIEILAIRVTKPEIPPKIRRAFEDIESERVKLMMVKEQQKTLLSLKEIERQMRLLEAQTALETSKIHSKMQRNNSEVALQVSKVRDQSFLEKDLAITDCIHFRESKELETLREKLMDHFMQFLEVDSLSTNLKIFFGDSIPESVILEEKKGRILLEELPINL
jgi:erlin